MTLFIYNSETAGVVEKVTGGTQEQQMDHASEHYDADDYGWTYSPAFGMADGLIDTGEAKRTNLPDLEKAAVIHTITTANGHIVTCQSTQTGENIVNIITVDGEPHSQDTIKAQAGWTNAEVEARTEAERVAEEVGRWKDGRALLAALNATERDEWEDGGEPENATEGTTWDFTGWNDVREQFAMHGSAKLGGDVYRLN